MALARRTLTGRWLYPARQIVTHLLFPPALLAGAQIWTSDPEPSASETSRLVDQHVEAFIAVGRFEESVHFIELLLGNSSEEDAGWLRRIALSNARFTDGLVRSEAVEEVVGLGALKD